MHRQQMRQRTGFPMGRVFFLIKTVACEGCRILILSANLEAALYEDQVSAVGKLSEISGLSF